MIRLIFEDQVLDLSVEQAEGVLKIQKETQLTSWQLPEDSPYQLVDGHLIKRGSTKTVPGKTPKERG